MHKISNNLDMILRKWRFFAKYIEHHSGYVVYCS